MTSKWTLRARNKMATAEARGRETRRRTACTPHKATDQATKAPVILLHTLIFVAMVLLSGCVTTTVQTKPSGWSVSGASVSGATEKPVVKARKKKKRIKRETPSEATAPKETTPPQESKPVATALTTEVPLGVDAANVVARKISRTPNEAHLIFDFPVTYNARVRKWVKYFQTTGRPSFRRWLERSTRFIPNIQDEMKRAGLPLDLAYVAMIESGFSSSASSHAQALGMWQFIAPTGSRYGLSIDWWIDERRDFEKSTKAAIAYMTDLYGQFGSWYLVAASYNMGENGVRRLIKRHKTNSFWDLADRGALPEETRNYLPKMLAAMLIAKAPALYGFRGLEFQVPYVYDTVDVPGGTDLINLANHLGVSERSLTELNPELLKAFIPREVKTHRIRIPKGSKIAVSQYVGTASDRRIQ